jgi:nucleotide-binding universal stress UspA family protein
MTKSASTLDDIKPIRLLVAVDGSYGSTIALQRAVQLVREVPAYEIVVIYVLEQGSASGTLISETDPEAESRARRVLSDATTFMKNEGVEVTTDLLFGSPVVRILEYADRFGPAMLLVGSRGMGHGKVDAVGSVAEAVSRRSRWPVLVVRS